ncbi:MAG: hypothetical protein LBL19_00765 [Spirochaetaceae bacterium]|jgi:hypothetical protein|nr:hypothetical protein [Spirochaetaceae bacterium]
METAEAFLKLEDLLTIFPLLKNREDRLTVSEYAVLNQIEKILYDHLSVQEIESRLENPVETP